MVYKCFKIFRFSEAREVYPSSPPPQDYPLPAPPSPPTAMETDAISSDEEGLLASRSSKSDQDARVSRYIDL